MKTIVELILRVIELLEAEGRQAKHVAVRVIAASLLWCAGLCLIVSAVLALAAALYLVLSNAMPAPLALAFVALFPLFGGVVAIFVGRGLLPGKGKSR